MTVISHSGLQERTDRNPKPRLQFLQAVQDLVRRQQAPVLNALRKTQAVTRHLQVDPNQTVVVHSNFCACNAADAREAFEFTLIFTVHVTVQKRFPSAIRAPD
jgi:hypothetical protein